jgi:formylglycine-generating enzyme required for sulfatase activity
MQFLIRGDTDMKRIGIALMALVLMGVGQAMAAPPVVSNVQVEIIDNQTPDLATPKGRVKITYDVADPDGGPLHVFVAATALQNNWSPQYEINVKTVSGDVTQWDRTSPQMPVANITPGTGKEIIWDAPADWPNQESTNLQVQVRAYDGDMNQIRVMLDSTRNITMDFVWIKPGSFTNGGTTYTLDEGIYFAKTELTQAQWTAVMGVQAFGSGGYTSNYPFNYNGNSYTTYNDIRSFLENSLPNKLRNGHYRAPTSAEWDYAARAGTATKFYFGDDVNALGGYEWYSTNSANQLKEVGGKWPNPWGLHDMLGNLYELTDWGYNSGYTYSFKVRGNRFRDSASTFDQYPYRSVSNIQTSSDSYFPDLTLRVVRTGP